MANLNGQTLDARQSGTFKIGGDLEVTRLGFGAMRITGPGIWGEPADRDEALRVLRRLPEVGVDFVDTADAYGPDVSENLIAEALAPYHKLVVTTKGANTRQGPDRWAAVGRPEYLRQCVLMSLRRLKLEQHPLWQLHRIDPNVPRDEQFGALREMQNEGLIRHLGLSEVSVEEVQAAQQHFQVTTVQNMYNLVTRKSEAVLEYCEAQGIGFIPWAPLAFGDLARPGSLLDGLALQYGAAPSQITLAWILQRSPVMLPIPGTSRVKHLEENVAAASLTLSDQDFQALDEQGRSLSA
ncbi:aldo/keto reductase [Deinococcus hopiensis]|uniref:Predicted oxidoreductase n=1 Tax=Deinococcus hopiensis KR-140 TaxID=695939 RepID=A0A1W1UAZ5_9DEIO|nr:aldo/keto reductase [Deinococcus hopiensis]SMB78229.1 Predicted oxidoreductase [Deinococcus hopiensis KR-140]